MPSNLTLLFADRRADFAMVFLVAFLLLVFLLGAMSEGCPRGFSLDRSMDACVDNSSLDQSQYRAAEIAVESLESSKLVVVQNVLTLKCPGCFKVIINHEDLYNNVTLMDWTVAESTGWK
ncbi:MAG: hypothetical protein MUP58_00595 [Candidatus Nanohaloarchaeota archaeon QJJ-9]|nr:hypothetical protein [Candidatus Nanohaloarchaeota archaeon QJJ-9]